MKKKEIRAALDAMRKVKVASIENKDIRNSFIDAHLCLLAEQRKFETEYSDMRTAFLESYNDEQDVVVKLQEKLSYETDPKKRNELAAQIAEHDKYLLAVREFNTMAEKMGEEEIKVKPIDMGTFVAEYQKQDYDMGVVEALFPLFA